MSDSDLGKKMVEEEHLIHFLDAYHTVTGVSLHIIGRGETPDFLCIDPSGQLVGVELARSPHDYERRIHDRIWGDCTMSAHDLLDNVAGMIAGKERKRQSSHWRTPHSTMLVIQLLDYTFDSLVWTRDCSLAEDYSETGFVEIWLADHSTLGAYSQVRLIGLHPRKHWGVHHQPALEQKPFG
jgi:hypothetical protein